MTMSHWDFWLPRAFACAVSSVYSYILLLQLGLCSDVPSSEKPSSTACDNQVINTSHC